MVGALQLSEELSGLESRLCPAQLVSPMARADGVARTVDLFPRVVEVRPLAVSVRSVQRFFLLSAGAQPPAALSPVALSPAVQPPGVLSPAVQPPGVLSPAVQPPDVLSPAAQSLNAPWLRFH